MKKKNSENPHFYKSVDSGWTPSPPSVEKIHTFNLIFFFEGFPQPQLLSTLGLQDTKNTDISELITSPCSRSSDNLLPDPYLAEPMSHMSRQSTIIQAVLCLQNGIMTIQKLFSRDSDLTTSVVRQYVRTYVRHQTPLIINKSPLISCSSVVHQMFISCSSVIHKSFVCHSFVIHQSFISHSSVIHKSFISHSSVIHHL